VTLDKHATAYQVLLGPLGQAIGKRLGLDHPEASVRCLACHTNPAVAADDVSPALIGERQAGVGCEACHGSARGWIEQHCSAEWQGLNDDAREKKYAKTGMMWLRTPAARARVCAGCHVGDAADPETGRPARDVNHDLIAAGHPRLAFEYTSYLANMPRHWQEKDRRPGSEALAWAVGQVVSSAADQNLLASRAQAGPWPEFAAYDCASCHHDLHDPSWRQARPGSSSPGALRPADWYSALNPLALAAFQNGEPDKPAADALRVELMRPLPDRVKVAEQARGIAKGLSAQAVRLEQTTPTGAQVDALRANLARHGADARDADWDELEQTALALLAVNRAYSEGRQPSEADRRADGAIREIVQRLAYPVRYNSPKQFRAAPGFDAELQHLFRQVAP
jgi:hypothetical protein